MNRPGMLKLGIFAAAVAGAIVLLFPYVRLETLVENYGVITKLVQNHAVMALAGYFLAYVLVVVLSLPVAVVMTMIGGALFGGLAGTVITVLAASTGATLLFLAARGLFYHYFLQKSGPWLNRLHREFHADAASYLFMLRLAPIFPFTVVNLAAGLLGARPSTYIWTTFLGIMPGTAAYTYVGSGLGGVLEAEAARLLACRQAAASLCSTSFDPAMFVSRHIAIGLAGLGILVLISIFVRRWAARTSAATDTSRHTTPTE